MRILKILIVLAALLAAGLLVFWVLSYRPAIEPVQRPDASLFDSQLVARGRQLAAIGNCNACHRSPEGASYAGGRPIPTPFGTVYATNITPDESTGIGRWSEEAFIRSMREGVGRDGRHLYPAFPYDHFTLVTDEDNSALYAYLMSQEPIAAAVPANELPFPLNMRPLIAGWKLLFFDSGVYRPDPARSQVHNRGAYLAEGLAHCGACHTPRNLLGARQTDRHWAGGLSGGWTAYAINAQSPAPIAWDGSAMAFYLQHGWHRAHGVSRGPMAEVTDSLGRAPEEDVAAIAAYVMDVMNRPPREPTVAERLLARIDTGRGRGQSSDSMALPESPGQDEGAVIYAAACASCHDSDRPQPFGGLDFHLSTAVHADNPQNIINVTLFGLPPRDGEASAIMPGYAGVISDSQMVAVLNYMRNRFTDRAPWPELDQQVSQTRTGQHPVQTMPADALETPPAILLREH